MFTFLSITKWNITIKLYQLNFKQKKIVCSFTKLWKQRSPYKGNIKCSQAQSGTPSSRITSKPYNITREAPLYVLYINVKSYIDNLRCS
jgi:hypothetical protein